MWATADQHHVMERGGEEENCQHLLDAMKKKMAEDSDNHIQNLIVPSKCVISF